jgi:2-iminobutanoate/2-iminopropanoate deaminase
MDKRAVSPAGCGSVKGPYSPAVVWGDLVFVSGQIPADPSTGALTGGGIEGQARRVFENVGGVLEAAGSGLERVLQVTLYLRDMADYAAVNAVYAEYFGPTYPSRACVAVAGLPLGVALEASVIAHR